MVFFLKFVLWHSAVEREESHWELTIFKTLSVSSLSYILFLVQGSVCNCTALPKWDGASELCRRSLREPLYASEWHGEGVRGRTAEAGALGWILDLPFWSQTRLLKAWTALQPLFPLLCFPVQRYVGELISDAEADVREDDSYLFDLDNKVSLSTYLVFL